MSWLREDDNFDSHPKILGLGKGDRGDARRWTWNRVLLYTTRYRSEVIPPNISESVPKAGLGFVNDCIQLGLIDVLENGTMVVHDWEKYQAGDPLKASRQAKWRASRNAPVDADVDAPVDGHVDADVAASRAGVPSRPVNTKSLSPSQSPEDTHARDDSSADQTDGRVAQQRISETHELVDGGHGYLIPRQTSDLPAELEAIDAPAILSALAKEHQ